MRRVAQGRAPRPRALGTGRHARPSTRHAGRESPRSLEPAALRAAPYKGMFPALGTWRSPVAHLNGVQGVAGSNPAVPMIGPAASPRALLVARPVRTGDRERSEHVAGSTRCVVDLSKTLMLVREGSEDGRGGTHAEGVGRPPQLNPAVPMIGPAASPRALLVARPVRTGDRERSEHVAGSTRCVVDLSKTLMLVREGSEDGRGGTHAEGVGRPPQLNPAVPMIGPAASPRALLVARPVRTGDRERSEHVAGSTRCVVDLSKTLMLVREGSEDGRGGTHAEGVGRPPQLNPAVPIGGLTASVVGPSCFSVDRDSRMPGRRRRAGAGAAGPRSKPGSTRCATCASERPFPLAGEGSEEGRVSGHRSPSRRHLPAHHCGLRSRP